MEASADAQYTSFLREPLPDVCCSLTDQHPVLHSLPAAAGNTFLVFVYDLTTSNCTKLMLSAAACAGL